MRELLRALPRGRPPPRLHPLPGPRLRLLAARARGLRAHAAAPGDIADGARPQRGRRWDEYRRDVLTALAVRLRRRRARSGRASWSRPRWCPTRRRPCSHKFQDWPRLVAGGMLDALCPMAYTPDSRHLPAAGRAGARARVGDRAAVWAGVGAYRLASAGIVEKVRRRASAGAAGVVLFSHESLAAADLARLRARGLCPRRAARPAPGREAAGAGRRPLRRRRAGAALLRSPARRLPRTRARVAPGDARSRRRARRTPGRARPSAGSPSSRRSRRWSACAPRASTGNPRAGGARSCGARCSELRVGALVVFESEVESLPRC